MSVAAAMMLSTRLRCLRWLELYLRRLGFLVWQLNRAVKRNSDGASDAIVSGLDHGGGSAFSVGKVDADGLTLFLESGEFDFRSV